MNYMVQIRPVGRDEILQVVAIHEQAFKDFFLTRLGPRFLQTYYMSLLQNPNGLLLGVYEQDRLVAFAASTTRSAGFHSGLIKDNVIAFGKIGCWLLFTRPAALIRLLRNLTKKSSVDDMGEYAELLSIGVAVDRQGFGYGKKLLLATEKMCRQMKCSELSLTTDALDNATALSFYEKQGYKVLSDFIAYPHRKMLRLIKTL